MKPLIALLALSLMGCEKEPELMTDEYFIRGYHGMYYRKCELNTTCPTGDDLKIYHRVEVGYGDYTFVPVKAIDFKDEK